MGYYVQLLVTPKQKTQTVLHAQGPNAAKTFWASLAAENFAPLIFIIS
jgi:hypothetical protein